MVCMYMILLLLPTLTAEKYSLLSSTPGFIDFLPGFHPAGQTSPCLSVNWNACTNLSASSTSLPTGKSLTVTCLSVCFPSMINSPRNVTPSSGLYTVCFRDLAVLIRKERDIHLTQPSLLTWGVNPCEVREVTVCGTADHFTSDFTEFLRPLAECYNLSRTHKCKVEWVEKEHHIFPLIIGK